MLEVWRDINEKITSGLTNRSEVYIPAVEKFGQHFNRLISVSENAVLSALHEFGQINFSMSTRVRKGRYVKVNQKSVQRRKTAVGGRKCAPQGRPRAAHSTAEHGYAEGVAKKKRALPHDLSYRIQVTAGKKRKIELNKLRNAEKKRKTQPKATANISTNATNT